ncbi:FtsX-like permease family protein [Peptococcus simiae]|uniref:FtsX-like permease family protein n=1 Tax=Peptococcus simiae TaxID=1643805 RepID=UPI003980696A
MRAIFNRIYWPMARASFSANRRFWWPYGLAVAVMLALFTVVCNIAQTPYARALSGVALVLQYGRWVTAIFTLVFVLYGGSFIQGMLRREMQLYNILGLEKGHIRRLMAVIQGTFSFLAATVGLALGYALSFFFLLLLTRLTGQDQLSLDLSLAGFLETLAIIAGILLANSLLAILRVGRPVKTRTFLKRHSRLAKTLAIGQSLLALACLGGGYWLSMTVTSGLEALRLFFWAVLLVMAGTWLLFSGALVLLLEGLQKRPGFYYRQGPFMTIGGILPRIRQHGIGLAGVAILLTMAIVSISFTATMYKESDNTVQERIPLDYWAGYSSNTGQGLSILDGYKQLHQVSRQADDQIRRFSDQVGHPLAKSDTRYSYTFFAKKTGHAYRLADTDGGKEGSFIQLASAENYPGPRPAPGEVICLMKAAPAKSLTLGGQTYRCKTLGQEDRKRLVKAVYGTDDATFDMIGSLLFSNEETVFTVLQGLQAERADGRVIMNADLHWSLEGKVSDETYLAPLKETLQAQSPAGMDPPQVNSQTNLLSEFLYLNGAILFIGILLGLVFMTGVVLVTYFKQISEALADRRRYHTMQEVGMDEGMVRRVLGWQTLILFALPILVACIHALAAYPMISLMLRTIGFNSANSYFSVIIPVVLAVVLAYIAAYQLIARTYRDILIRHSH